MFHTSASEAFASVEYIIARRVGRLADPLHARPPGASLFFIVVYLHMFRAMIYGSYRSRASWWWIIGMLIFLTLMAEAFMGYVLPWGQIELLGAQVITPVQHHPGDRRGPDRVDPRRLPDRRRHANRFFACTWSRCRLVILLLVVLHRGALHEVGSNIRMASTSRRPRTRSPRSRRRHPFPLLHGEGLVRHGLLRTIAAFILSSSRISSGVPEPAQLRPGQPMVRRSRWSRCGTSCRTT